MATEKEKETAGLSTAEKNRLDDEQFAFPGSARSRWSMPLTSATPWRDSTRWRA